jgi:hypothetical protein
VQSRKGGLETEGLTASSCRGSKKYLPQLVRTGRHQFPPISMHHSVATITASSRYLKLWNPGFRCFPVPCFQHGVMPTWAHLPRNHCIMKLHTYPWILSLEANCGGVRFPIAIRFFNVLNSSSHTMTFAKILYASRNK